MRFSIIIPLYNEEKTINELLFKLHNIDFYKYFEDVEIIVVDDGSTDNSLEIVKNFPTQKYNIKIIKNETNRGKGYSLIHGIKISKGDIILFQDADLELLPEDIPSIIETMFKLNVDLVNGSRYLPGIPRPLSSYYRYLGNKLFSLITSLILNVKLTDIACGYKLIKKSLLDKIELKEEKFGIEAELIIKALKINKFKIAEVPVQYIQRTNKEGKKLKNIDAIKILLKIIKYAFFKD